MTDATETGAAQGDREHGGKRELRGLLEDAKQAGDKEDPRFGDVVEALEHRGFGALIVLPALLAVLPTGAIPGMGIATGTMILLVAVQMVMRRRHPWLPQRLRRVHLGRSRLEGSLDTAEKGLEKLGPLLKRRLDLFTGTAGTMASALVLVLIGLSMFPLALIPGGNAASGAAALVIAMGLLSKDGLWVLVGLIAAAGALYLATTLPIIPP